ncbi:hypothetical protein AcW1_008298 [Taiwanofungus camphoratus]|nr:hypothetical protein AcV5_008592 [Antrodia cinnamomea]KAI0951188.1 hypothetical protein AcW1_008298 [Antrodia cinnamomea]KAI0956076.1 hypothetical protein AcV7_006581 [Antrodia cinnamomea]
MYSLYGSVCTTRTPRVLICLDMGILPGRPYTFVILHASCSIEHLPEETLQEFAPILLGIYHPQFLLITTPSYTFNARFTPPESPASLRSGYPDPTGRTTRIFRHHDHKFEWTVEEFTAWCKSVAGEWGYDVEIGGVGKAQEKDEWERDDELGYASQVAAFRRREGDQYDRQRRERCSNLGIYQKTGARERHNLLITHHHVASKHARQPKSLLEIGETVKAKMLYYQESTMSVAELWFEKDIGFSCGGWIEVMTLAVEEHEALHLSKVHSEGIIKLKVQLLAETQSESVLRPVGVPMEEGKDHDFPVGLLEVSPVEEQPVWGDVESQWGPFLPITQGDTVSVAEDTDSLSQVCSHGWSLAETSEQVWDSIEGWSRLEKVITTGSDSVW